MVDNYTVMDRKIERVQFDAETEKVKLQWRYNYTDGVFQNSTYDYAVVAVPFTIVKKWRLPGKTSLPVFILMSPMSHDYKVLLIRFPRSVPAVRVTAVTGAVTASMGNLNQKTC